MADPWASVGAPVPQQPAADPWASVGAVPRAEPTARATGQPAPPPTPAAPSIWDKIGHRVAEIPQAAYEGQKGANQALAEDFAGPKSNTDMEKIGRVAKTTMDVVGYPFAAAGAALHNVAGGPTENLVGKGTVAGKLVGNTVDAALSLLAPEAAGGRLSAEARAAAAGRETQGLAKEWNAVGKPVKAADRTVAASSAKAAARKHIYGDEPAPTTRLDNALYRAQGGTTADKLEVQEFLKSVPEEAHDPAKQEALYHELEQAMVDPGRKLSPEAEAALEHFKPYYEEQTDLVNNIRKKGAKSGTDVEPYLYDQGYVARRAEGHTPAMDDLAGSRDPITGRSLTKSTNALKSRMNNVVLQGKDGESYFIKGADPHEYKVGETVKGSFDKPLKVRQATTAEIEANTDIRYHKNAMVNTMDNVVKLRQVSRNIDLLNAALKDMSENGTAFRKEWTYKNDAGETVVHKANGKEPDGFVELHNIPQLKGYSFAPEIAEVFKDYKPPPGTSTEDLLTKINRGLTSTLFWNPVPHAWNVANHWAVGRGFDWMTPGGYKSLVTTGARAVHDVLTKSEAYRDMLREGSGLLYGNTQTQNFYDLMLRKGVNEFRDPKSLREIASSFRLKDLNPAKLMRAIYGGSNKILWGANDIFQLQRQYELMGKGMDARAAIGKAEKDIPNYRIPSRVMGSRAVSEMLRNPNMMLFGRYRYGQIRAWGSMFHDMYKGDPKDRMEAAGKFLVAMIIAGGAYPLADGIVKAATGNKDARVKRGGGFGPVDAVYQLSQGQKDWSAAMSTLIDPAPVIRATEEGLNNREGFSGRKIIEPEGTIKQKAVEAGEYAAGYVPPAEMALGMTDPQSAARAAGRNVLLELPTDKQEAGKAKGKKYDQRNAKSRAKKDPILRMLGGP